MSISLCSTYVTATVIINEIMYNPAGNEHDFEYIELYAENTTVTNWTFEGISFTFPNITLNGYIILSNRFMDNGSNNDFSDRYNITNMTIYEFKGSLKNKGETIILRNNKGKFIDVVTYGDWARENHSIERITQKGYSSDPLNWKESGPGGTPGKPTPNETHNKSQDNTSCDWEINVIINKSIAQKPEWKIKAQRITGKGKINLTLHHWIEDQDSNVIKNYTKKIEVTRTKTTTRYKPNLNPGAYIIRTAIKTNCDKNKKNNELSHLIVVTGKKIKNINQSSIVIDSTNTAQFGKPVNVKIQLYRGETKKYAIKAVIKKKGKSVSNKLTLYARTPFTNYSIIVPILINSCNKKTEEGMHEIVVEGLGIIQRKEIMIENCEEDKEKKTKKSTTIKAKQTEEEKKSINEQSINQNISNLSNRPVQLTKSNLKSIPEIAQKRGIIIYESTSVKAYQKAPGVFISSLTLLAIIIFKKF